MLQIKNLSKSYHSFQALDIDELLLEDNKFYGVIGNNGAGKTTLFKCITNVVNSYTGDIILDSQNTKANPSILAKVGLVLDGMSVYQEKTGWFNIKYFSGLRDVYDKNKILELARNLKIEQALEQKVKTYSYGMKKKLILLIALMSNPKLLILDEPFRGLDNETVSFFKLFLKKLQNDGLTLLISSHILSDIEGLCDEVINLDKGRIVNKINLSNTHMLALRYIKTNDNKLFQNILDEHKFGYVKQTDNFKIDINDKDWDYIYNILYENKIKIIEMIPVSVLMDNLNNVKGEQ